MACIVIKTNPNTIGIGPGDRFVSTRSWGNWHFHRRRWLVWNTRGKPSEGGYEVDLWGIDSHQELVDWLFHIGGKTTDPHHFFDAMQEIFRTAGWSDTFCGKDLAIKFWEGSVPHPKGRSCPHCHTWIAADNKEPNGKGNGCQQCIDKL